MYSSMSFNFEHYRFCTQPPIELLRQTLDQGGWYARDNTFRGLADITFAAAMGLPGGARTSLTDRYLRHFSTVSVTEVGAATG
jgi:dynein heavy chain